MRFRIETLHAYIAVDPKDPTADEGVCGFLGRDGTWVPMVAADPVRLLQLRPIAERISRTTGVTIKLVRFSTRTDVETIGN